MKVTNAVLPAIAGTVCCLVGSAMAQSGPTTSARGPVVVKQIVGQQGVSFADNCGDAPAVGAGTYSYDLSVASNDYSASCGDSADAPDLWLRYVPSANGIVTASTCSMTSGDTVLVALDACGGAEIDCNDDTCSLRSEVTFGVTAGQSYYFRVCGYGGEIHTGEVTISFDDGSGGPANDFCANAQAVTPGVYDFDTTTANSDGSSTCGGSKDIWYSVFSPTDASLVVTTCGLASHDTILTAFAGCGGAELECNDDGCDVGLQSYFSLPVSAGSTTLVRLSGYNGASGAGQFSVELNEACSFTVPSGAIAEPESCGEDVNGGCNSDTGGVTQVSVDSVISGTAWAQADFRDTDWYEFTLDSARDLTVTGTGHFPMRIFVLDTNCDPTVFGTNASTAACEEVSLTVSLEAGTYRVFAGVDAFSGVPCGTWANGYVLTIGNPSEGCPADFNGDDFLDFFDYDDYVNCFETGNCPPGKTADFNGDEFVDFFDYDDFVAAFETGC